MPHAEIPWPCARPLLGGLALLLTLLAPEARAEERFALLIGANVGWANDRPLRYAESDAERMKDVLVELGGFPVDRVVVLRDPDTAEVRSRLERFAATLRGLGRDSLFVFYYSGHADERHLHLSGKPLPITELRAALESLPATVRVGVMDACRSGSLLAAKGGAPASAFEMQVVDELRARGLALLASSGADELSQETKALAGSVFTHHLVSGLRGAADSDADGAVVLSEAWRYAYQRTEADTAPTPVPHHPAYLHDLTGQGEPVLTRLERARGRLVLPGARGTRYVVVDASEVRLVAEAQARPEGPVVLALAPGRYRVKRVRGERLEVADVFVDAGARVEAAGLVYREKPLAGGLLKGRPDEGDVEAWHEWRRGEALRLLAAGEAGAALGLFEELLARDPADTASRRGRVRALVRLSESYARVGDRERKEEALRAALKAEPGLVNDEDLRDRRSELLALPLTAPVPTGMVPKRGTGTDFLAESSLTDWLVSSVLHAVHLQVVSDVPEERGAASGRNWRWRLGLEPLGPRGLFGVVGSYALGEWLQVGASFDLGGLGVGLGVRFSPRRSEWAGYIGAGGHLALGSTWDVPLHVGDEQLSYQHLWKQNLFTEMGLRYLSPQGLWLELGLGIVFHPREGSSAKTAHLVPGLGAGLCFPSSP